MTRKQAGMFLLSVPWCCVASITAIAFSFAGVLGTVAAEADHFAHVILPISCAVHCVAIYRNWHGGERRMLFLSLAVTVSCIGFHLSPWHDAFLAHLAHAAH